MDLQAGQVVHASVPQLQLPQVTNALGIHISTCKTRRVRDNATGRYAERSRKWHTSLPSQNSDSVICPVITRSLCNANSSGFDTSTFFLSLKSLAASVPVMIGDLPSLTTDAALEMEALDGAAVAGVSGFEGARGRAGFGVGAPDTVGVVLDPLRFRLMMFVSSDLNLSLSERATGWGSDVKVKLWPASSLTRPSLRRTCAAPSLLQKRAVHNG